VDYEKKLHVKRGGKESGDVIAFVTVNGQSKVKLFDDKQSYLNSISSNSGGRVL
jgi:hypothetical protein